MLKRLAIRDFVIVDRLDLEFEPGFTALTGETGAGKSILLDALALALGDRADPDSVRSGAGRAEVEVEFDLTGSRAVAAWLAEQSLEGDADTLLVRRVVERGGRTRAFVNGRSTTLAQLREVGEQLVDIHGQQAHQHLVRPDMQREVLDLHGGLQESARAVGEAWRVLQRAREALAARERDAAARAQERDRLAWQHEELKRVAPLAGEWETVQADQGRLAHAAALIDGAGAALEALAESDGSALAAVNAVLARLRGIAGYDSALTPSIELLEAGEAQLQEAAHGLRRYRDRVDLDPERLREVEHRMTALHDTARKLRTRPEELPGLFDQVSARLEELEAAEDDAALAAAEAAARAGYERLAALLSEQRRKAAARLSREVSAVMKDLALGSAKFEVSLVPVSEGSVHGAERIEFLIATNPGVEPRPLARVASGGELSRVSLAIEVVTSGKAAVPTLIFDEVDAGIGGAVAETVGRRLAALGRDRQVLCVTHLPQVAAQAAQQWSVAKSTHRGVTRSEVTPLDASGRVEEIARMLGGAAITATTRRHAAEMLAGRSAAR